MSSFALLKAALRDWPDAPVPADSFPENPHERLRRALRSIKGCGRGDLVALIRHVLRTESITHGVTARLTVPSDAPFPNEDEWGQGGCRVRKLTGNRMEVQAAAWRPAWLNPLLVREGATAPFDSAEGQFRRRVEDMNVPADPALETRFRHPHYLSSAQAEAIRSTMLSPPGSVHLIVMPTGAGKSLVGLSAALLGQGEGAGVSVVVVPTIALAYDQVKSARELCPGEAIDAWESGLSAEKKRAIRERLNAGTQRLLFAAPESVVSGLATLLSQAAVRGELRAFVVDEAHLVGQWGASFRPEFQSMSALWRDLFEKCPPTRRFRTLLMTATLTEETFKDLNTFYGPLGREQCFTAVYLRAEPDYFEGRCESDPEKIARVLETLRHAPRPAILYVTTKDDARAWHRRCLDVGWRRTGLVHGDSSATEREAAVDDWREGKLDLMVATSAFGLGMDKRDVRVIVHACVPETLDRFYQEVGRAGRDGVSCASVLLWTDADLALAERMSSAAIISDELGLERWRSMWSNPQSRQEGEFRLLNLRAIRPDLHWDSDDNAKWNLRTVLLLARTGVLDVRYRSIPELPRNPGETDEAFERRRKEHWEREISLCAVQLRQNNPLNQAAWTRVVVPHRDHTRKAASINWRRMLAILQRKRELEGVLQEVYQVREAGVFHVGASAEEVVVTLPDSQWEIKTPLPTILAVDTPTIVTYRSRQVSRSDLARALVEVLTRLAALGMREFALPDGWRNRARWLDARDNPIPEMLRRSLERFIVVRGLTDAEPLLSGHVTAPRVSLLPPENAARPIPEALLLVRRPLHLVLAPEESPDHRHPARRLRDGPHMRLEEFQRLLNQ